MYTSARYVLTFLLFLSPGEDSGLVSGFLWLFTGFYLFVDTFWVLPLFVINKIGNCIWFQVRFAT